jgi:hypothetical protein
MFRDGLLQKLLKLAVTECGSIWYGSMVKLAMKATTVSQSQLREAGEKFGPRAVCCFSWKAPLSRMRQVA